MIGEFQRTFATSINVCCSSPWKQIALHTLVRRMIDACSQGLQTSGRRADMAGRAAAARMRSSGCVAAGWDAARPTVFLRGGVAGKADAYLPLGPGMQTAPRGSLGDRYRCALIEDASSRSRAVSLADARMLHSPHMPGSAQHARQHSRSQLSGSACQERYCSVQSS
jgi:hypothetical protein